MLQQDFAGCTARVTGGIGLGIAQELVDRGANVVITARKPDELEARPRGNSAPAQRRGQPAVRPARGCRPRRRAQGLRGQRGGGARVGAVGMAAVDARGGRQRHGRRERRRPRSGSPIGAYNASKAVVIHLLRQLGAELGPVVRVNAIAPAVVKTRFAQALYEGREEQVAASYPMGRLGVAEDTAKAAAFCCRTTPPGSPGRRWWSTGE